MGIKNQGFTLIELMVVVVIVGVLVAFAYPSYQESVRKTKRTDAQADMMHIASRLQKYKIVNFSFIKADDAAVSLSDIGVTIYIPQSGPTLYNLALSNVTAGTWTLTATPTGVQTGDGDIVLNHRGEKCWDKGNKTTGVACVPSPTTNWDGR